MQIIRSLVREDKFKMKKLLLTTLLTSSLSVSAYAEDYNITTEKVLVIGSAEEALTLGGSGTLINKENLEKYGYTDIHRVLQSVPGVNIQEEEGYGNRPNIGIRGSRSERSGNITLMEDGILIAPAPYAAPSAYYFPRVARMEAVEVTKGPSTIKYGPRTTSGAVNLISSPVPNEDEQGGNALLGLGNYGTERAEFNYGARKDGLGFVFDFGHEATTGFKDLPNGADTGYDIRDGMAKLSYEADNGHSFEFKLGATYENSQETYMGISDADFAADAYQRYAASANDTLNTRHKNYSFTHAYEGENFEVVNTIYRNDFFRNWFRVRQLDGSGLSDAIATPTSTAILRGDTGTSGTLTYRANQRSYRSDGIKSDATYYINDDHAVDFGVLLHKDFEKRDQFQQDFGITDGVIDAVGGAQTPQSDRLTEAYAQAVYIKGDLNFGDLTVTPGVRYEDINFYRNGTKKEVDALVFGIGANYQVSDSVAIYAGINEGFSPPSASGTADKEESLNYELGLRYYAEDAFIDAGIFFNDYSNLIAECTDSSGCGTASIGDEFNGNEVDSYGLELSAGYEFDIAEDIDLDIEFTYTYNKTEFNSSFASSFDEWGDVVKGDELPYIPEHQAYLSLGLSDDSEDEDWAVNLGIKYVDKMRTSAGQGAIPAGEGTDSRVIFDLAGEYRIWDNAKFFVNAENITDEEYIASRRPAGLRPGKPLTVLAGLKFDF